MEKRNYFKSSVSFKNKLHARVCVFKMKHGQENHVFLHIDYIADNKRNTALSFNASVIRESLMRNILDDVVKLVQDHSKSLTVDKICRMQLTNLVKKYAKTVSVERVI